MTCFKVYPYKQGSASAKLLSEGLGGRVLKVVGSRYKPKEGDVVLNWGAKDPPELAPALVLNRDVGVAQCKLASLRALSEAGIRVPPFWTNREDIPEGSFPIVCRTKLRGQGGDGIVIANTPDELVPAPLYTKYIKKKHEYRVHVLRGQAFFVQRKAKKVGVENPNWKVRNLAGGFVFVEEPLENVPGEVIVNAELAVGAVGIDFGGVDVIWNALEGKGYVLEINTACGLEPRTAVKYAEAVADYL